MSAPFSNVYDDATRAEAYATLGFPGTYYLAFRDLPALIARHVHGVRALDFGCGAGRSTRFLTGLGFRAVGVDISGAMLERARQADPDGDYRLVRDGSLDSVAGESYDLVLSAFTFDNIPTRAKPELLTRLRGCLAAAGRIVNLVSAPDIYTHEWVSFSTRDFPENRTACDGDVVRIVMLDVADRRPVEDVFCSDAEYRRIYRETGLTVAEAHKPLGRAEEPHAWVSETTVSPWTVYLLEPAATGAGPDSSSN